MSMIQYQDTRGYTNDEDIVLGTVSNVLAGRSRATDIDFSASQQCRLDGIFGRGPYQSFDAIGYQYFAGSLVNYEAHRLTIRRLGKQPHALLEFCIIEGFRRKIE